MPFNVTVQFSVAMTEVIITDKVSNTIKRLGSVSVNHRETVLASHHNGEAMIHVSGKEGSKFIEGQEPMDEGETYVFPPPQTSVLDDLMQFKDLNALVNQIDTRLKKSPTKSTKT